MKRLWQTAAVIVATIICTTVGIVNATEVADRVAEAKTSASDYIGVSSCGRSGCHGGPEQAEAGRHWRSAYSIWASQDPHSNAFAVLKTSKARNMVKMLAEFEGQTLQTESDSSAYFDFLRQNCNSCHATASNQNTDTDHLLADGVGCESCHGPAGGWVVAHRSDRWHNLRADDRYGGQWNMYDTQDLMSRAEMCAQCHVGDGAGRREVNHDLIAAGHPRMNFEFSAYLANMPSHWDRNKDRIENGGPEFDLRAWFVGQTAAASIALDLLRARAEDGKVWPEFSEYDCFSCHHDLQSQGFRQRRGSPGRPGFYRWGTWYFSMPERLAATWQLTNLTAGLEQLASEMSKPYPNAQLVQNLSSSAQDQLKTLLTVTEQRMKSDERSAILSSIFPASYSPSSWDEATQSYLALSAWGSWDDSANQAWDSLFEKLHQTLQFPVDEIRDPQGKSTQIHYKSPRRFDPRGVEFTETFQRTVDAILRGEPSSK